MWHLSKVKKYYLLKREFSLKLGISFKRKAKLYFNLFQRLKHMILEAFMEKKGKK